MFVQFAASGSTKIWLLKLFRAYWHLTRLHTVSCYAALGKTGRLDGRSLVRRRHAGYIGLGAGGARRRQAHFIVVWISGLHEAAVLPNDVSNMARIRHGGGHDDLLVLVLLLWLTLKLPIVRVHKVKRSETRDLRLLCPGVSAMMAIPLASQPLV